MSSRSIFRQVALERLSTPEQLDQAIRITNATGWLALWTLLGLIAAAAVWSAVATVPINVTGPGILIQPGGVLNVVTASEGLVTELLVQPGDVVEQGQVVARIDQTAVRQDLALAEDELAELVAEGRGLLALHSRSAAAEQAFNAQKRDDLRQSLDFLGQRLALVRERQEAEDELWEKGVIPRQRLVVTRLEINEILEATARTEAALKLIDLDEAATATAREREVMASQRTASAVRRRVEALRDTLERRSKVTSPYAGQAVELQVNPGEIVRIGMPLLSLLPDAGRSDDGDGGGGQDLVAILYLSPADGKRVRPGMGVGIAPRSVAREEYGSILGRVQGVARIPSTDQGMMRVLKNEQLVRELAAGGAPIEVRVELLRDASTPTGYRWSSSRGPETEINTGTLIGGEVTVGKESVLGLVIPGLVPLLGSAAAGAAP